MWIWLKGQISLTLQDIFVNFVQFWLNLLQWSSSGESVHLSSLSACFALCYCSLYIDLTAQICWKWYRNGTGPSLCLLHGGHVKLDCMSERGLILSCFKWRPGYLCSQGELSMFIEICLWIHSTSVHRELMQLLTVNNLIGRPVILHMTRPCTESLSQTHLQTRQSSSTLFFTNNRSQFWDLDIRFLINHAALPCRQWRRTNTRCSHVCLRQLSGSAAPKTLNSRWRSPSPP